MIWDHIFNIKMHIIYLFLKRFGVAYTFYKKVLFQYFYFKIHV